MPLLPASTKMNDQKKPTKREDTDSLIISLWIFFSDAQGQLTMQSVVGSGQNSKSFKLLCMSSLPARMKRIGLKTAEKTWLLPCPHYNPMGAICCRGQLSSSLILP